jgi:hypothetical protein
MSLILKMTTILALSLATAASANTSQNAERLAAGLQRALSAVSQAVAAAGGGLNTGGVVNPTPWDMIDDIDTDLVESDAFSLPIYVQAGASLGRAASDADQAKLNYLSGNIAFANYKFSSACVTMGLARSQVARANSAALLPPAGFLAAFGPELASVVSELFSLRISEGCP